MLNEQDVVGRETFVSFVSDPLSRHVQKTSCPVAARGIERQLIMSGVSFKTTIQRPTKKTPLTYHIQTLPGGGTKVDK